MLLDLGMTAIRHLSRVAVAAAATFSGAYVLYNNSRKPAQASGSDDHFPFGGRLLFQPSGQRWDSNWDMQENCKKRRKGKEDYAGIDNTNSDVKEIKPTAIRHLIFIRHGQYNDKEEKDSQRTLTDLGR